MIVPDFDPCLDYTVMDEPWRATNYTDDIKHNDEYYPFRGWQRLMYNGQTIRMPEYCVPKGCGTEGPLWLNGIHPRLEDGIVERDICFVSSTEECCKYTRTIVVKACPGNFYVYKFVRPFNHYAYCAGKQM